MYNSKYYTCDQIDQRLLQNYYDDAVAAGYTDSKSQYLAGLLKAINYSANPYITADKVIYDPAISGLSSKNVKLALDELTQKLDTQYGRLEDLEKTMWPLKVTLTASPTLVEYTGSNQIINLVAITTRKDNQVVPGTLSLTKDGTIISSKPLAKLTVTDNINKRGITTYKVSVSTQVPYILSAMASVQVNSVLPIYMGFTVATSLTESTLKELDKQSIRTSPNGSYTINNPTKGAYVWFCVPDDMVIHKVTLNGFDVPMESPVTVSTLLGNYKCYRNSNSLVNQSFTFIIS